MVTQDNCIQKRKITLNVIKQPRWFNRDISKAIKNRQKLYKLSKQQSSQESLYYKHKLLELRVGGASKKVYW